MTTDCTTDDSLPSLTADVISGFEGLSKLAHRMPGAHLRTRPVLGGVFGFGGYALCSFSVVLNGLDEACYFVRESESKFVVGSGSKRAEAIAQARKTLTLIRPCDLHRGISHFKKHCADLKDAAKPQIHDEVELERAAAKREPRKPAPIPRRRKLIFEASNGLCHYCGTALVLTGKWHIEHKMPKALMGDDSPSNLVAACTSCNHKKRDTTDQEFIAKRKAIL